MRQKTMVASIPELSVFALRHARECGGKMLPEGAKGTIVHAYRDGAGYEVEFDEPFHCVLTVGSSDIQQV
ncbi:MAG TPA: hypothetical protein VM782_01660 [Stellaceae bacterium]|nr:hypothetical protein [Stellaceae bacterium]